MTIVGAAQNDSKTTLDIGVVGASIAGLSATWLLAQRYRVASMRPTIGSAATAIPSMYRYARSSVTPRRAA